MAAADLVQEWRTADDAALYLLQGEQVWLQAGPDKFWAVYREPVRKEARGAAIVLPDSASRPISVRLVEPLAATLRQAGWQVLVLQPPQPGETSFPHDAHSRLQAAVSFLAGKKQKHMALVGMGDSAVAALDYAVRHDPPQPHTPEEVEALRRRGLPVPLPFPAVRLAAAVGLPWEEGERKAPLSDWLKRIRMPLADYYLAERDGKVEEAAMQRRIAAKGNEDYRQLRFANPDPSAWSEQNMLAKRLAGWLGNAMDKQLKKLEEEQKAEAERKASGAMPYMPPAPEASASPVPPPMPPVSDPKTAPATPVAAQPPPPAAPPKPPPLGTVSP